MSIHGRAIIAITRASLDPQLVITFIAIDIPSIAGVLGTSPKY